jgi:hypothetical protein
MIFAIVEQMNTVGKVEKLTDRPVMVMSVRRDFLQGIYP